MCGIVAGFHWKKAAGDANDFIHTQFSDQKNRGSDGFGMVLFDKTRKISVHRNTHIAGAYVDIKLERAKGVLFHHRLPTSTPNWTWQTHPILVSHDELSHNWYFAHNGIINNPDVCRLDHVESGYDYQTAYEETVAGVKKTRCNDSEALAVDVVRFLEGVKTEIAAKGSAAWIALKVDKTTGVGVALYWGRNNSNPLYVDLDETEGTLHLSSEGYGTMVVANKAFCMDLKTREVTEQDMVIPEYVYSGYSAGFRYEEDDYEKAFGTSTYTGTSLNKVSDKLKEKEDKAAKKEAIAKSVKEALDEALELDRELDDLNKDTPPKERKLMLVDAQLDALKEHAQDCVEAAFDEIERIWASGNTMDGQDVKSAIDVAVPGVVASIKEARKLVNESNRDVVDAEPKTEVEEVREYLSKV